MKTTRCYGPLKLAGLTILVFGMLAAQTAEPPKAAVGDPWNVDFRYAPEWWQTAICLPDDWQKTMVAKEGELLYDFSSGTSLESFRTRLSFGLAESELTWVRQELSGPRVPIVRTWKRSGPVEIIEETFAAATPVAERSPQPPAGLSVLRLDSGLKRVNWAAPAMDCDPAFRDAAVGLPGEPVRYRFPSMISNFQPTVVFGLCEGYHTQPGRRILALFVENKKVKTVDLVAEHGRNVPAVYAFPATDVNRDGWIDVAVAAAPDSPDRTAVLNLFYGFYNQPAPIEKEMIAGRDRSWSVRQECGSDLRPGVPRQDVMIVRMRNTAQSPVMLRPRMTLQSKFPVHTEAGGRQLTLGGGTAITATQGFKATESTTPGTWLLDFDTVTLAGGQECSLAFGVIRGAIESMMRNAAKAEQLRSRAEANWQDLNLPYDPIDVPDPGILRDVAEAEQLRSRAETYWQELDLPYDRIEVPDPGIQALLDASIRNIYQAREIKNGQPVFQDGPTSYRGLWMLTGGAFAPEAMSMLGRTAEAGNAIRHMLEFQSKDGCIELLKNKKLWNETGIAIWSITRYARLTNDKAWLCEVWPNVEQAVAFIQDLRRRAATDPKAANYRLMPVGFGDGGAAGDAVYSNSEWTLAGIKAAAEAAEWLGKADQARLWHEEFKDFLATYHKAVESNMRLDKFGNRVIPVSMNVSNTIAPHKGLWAFQHAIFPGKLFASDDPLMRGTLASLQANEREGGLVGGTCSPTSIWTYEGSFYAHDWLWLGDGEKAARTLYAYANHASPLGDWREIQTFKGETPVWYFGDMPHGWATVEFIRLMRHLLVLERGKELHLFEGLPASWLKPGAVVRLREVLTDFGTISLELSVAPDAKTVRLHLEPPRRNPPEAIKLHLGCWATGPKGEAVLSLPLDKVGDCTLSLKANKNGPP